MKAGKSMNEKHECMNEIRKSMNEIRKNGGWTTFSNESDGHE
jgi:hypothetical protein